jgi:hypothetical protein
VECCLGVSLYVVKLYEHIEIEYAGDAHKPRLKEDDYYGSGGEEVIEAIVFVGQAEDRPVPEYV